MEQLIIITHVLIALGIIGLVLIQQGKGADMGASFGAGSSQTVFGPRGPANVLTRLTAILVAAFFATSFALALTAKHDAAAVGKVAVPAPVVVHSAPEQPAPVQNVPAAGAQDAAGSAVHSESAGSVPDVPAQ